MLSVLTGSTLTCPCELTKTPWWLASLFIKTDGDMFGQELKRLTDLIQDQYGKNWLDTLNTTALHFCFNTLYISLCQWNDIKNWYYSYEVKLLDELETKVEPAVHELRLGWSTDDTDMQLGKNFKHGSYCISRKYLIKVNIVLEM